MIRAANIRSLTEFRENAKAHLDRLGQEGGADVLTVNGEARGVVMSPAEFDRLAELAHQAEVTAKIRESMAQFDAGRSVQHPEGLRSLADELGVNPDR